MVAGMRLFHSILTTLALCCASLSWLPAAEKSPKANTLTAEETKAGWQLLFDGESTAAWKRYGRDTFPTTGWKTGDGWLIKVAGEKGGNLVTRELFSDFEFSWEWSIGEGGNNGVKYFVDESRGEIGHEYQMLGRSVQLDQKGSTGSFYAVLAPEKEAPVKLAPEVNHSRIVVKEGRVEHWLNGVRVLAYACGSEAVMAGVAASKFKDRKDFGKQLTARIMLTDHNDGCRFRNLKIRKL